MYEKASDKLLNLKWHCLSVTRTLQGPISVCYEGADILDPPFRVGVCGYGDSFEEACEDYYKKISGKTLVFGEGDHRVEVTIL